MIVLVPQEITPADIVSYNITNTESGASPYDGETVYQTGIRCTSSNSIYQALVGDDIADIAEWTVDAVVAGEKRYVEATHKIYQANTDTTNQYPPNYTTGENPVWTDIGWVNRGVTVTDTTYWVRVGATNYWGMFDPYTDTQTVGTEAAGGGFEIVAEINASKCNAASLFNVAGDMVELSIVRGESVLWAQTIKLVQRSSRTYSDYFFGRNIKIVSSMYLRFPAYFNTLLKVRVYGKTSAKCGMLTRGYVKQIATTKYGASLSIVDYSTVDTNIFGVTTITKRKTKKKLNIPMRVETRRISEFYKFFNAIPSTPCTFICDNDGKAECMTVNGIYRDFNVVVEGAVSSDCTLEILGIN